MSREMHYMALKSSEQTLEVSPLHCDIEAMTSIHRYLYHAGFSIMSVLLQLLFDKQES